MKSINIAKDKGAKISHKKSGSTVKKIKTKKHNVDDLLQMLKAKRETIKKTQEELYNQAAVIIQRWYRGIIRKRL